MPKSLNARIFWAVAAGYLLLLVFCKPSVITADVATFWLPAADRILAGHWLDLYSFRYHCFGLAFPNASPLFNLILVPPIVLARAVGLDPAAGGAVFQALLLGAFDVLAAWQLARLAGELRESDEPDWLAGVLYLAGFTTAFATVGMVHQEGLIVLGAILLLRGLRRGRILVPALLVAGLMLLKTSSAALLVPIGAWWLKERPRQAALGLAASVALYGAAMAPYLIWRFPDAWYSLVEFEGQRIIVGVTPLKLFQGGSLELWVRAWSNYVILAAVIGVSVWAFVYRRWALTSAAGLWVLLACGLLPALIGKWIYPHYLQVGFGLLVLWSAVRAGEQRWLWPVCFAAGAYLCQGLRVPDILNRTSPAVELRGVGWFLFGVAILALTGVASWRRSPALEGSA